MGAFCECTLEYLEARYSEDEFARLNAAIRSPEAQRTIRDATAACTQTGLTAAQGRRVT